MEDKKTAIVIENLDKIYKLYDKPTDRIKEAFGLGRHKKHTQHFALQGVNLEVAQGETVGIIGTNGSGKSTILKIITGVLNPTAGKVEVNGRISALLELGAGFNMEYTGIENIYLNGTMLGFSEEEIDAKMQEILDFADIGDFVHQPVKTYSSGMFVRLAFAVAINIEPEILIVDEALSVGDVFFQAKCYHKFEEFKEMGKTILFVSHDLSSISKYCDRVVLLNKGHKLGEGTPKEMIDIYKRLLVGQYTLPDEEDAFAEESAAEQAAADKTQGDETPDARTPDTLEYGTKQAEITEFFMQDESGVRTNTLIKGSRFSIHMKVVFHETIHAPIFAFTIKNVKGVEITGTNTMFERAFLEPVQKGGVKEVVFTQKIDLQGGEYLLSLGVTGYEGEDFKAYHRLYDVLDITVISDKNTVGYYDMNTTVTVSDAADKSNIIPYRANA